MFGTNPIRPPEPGDGSALDVQEIFATLQGEGLYAGWPAVFIRLGGCNLACNFCDTEFETFRFIPLGDIIADVMVKAGHATLIVITGGEPLRQNIAPLCQALLDRKFRVQIETNGTLYRELPENVDIVCSPKNTGQGYYPIRPDLLAKTSALKFIISAHNPLYRNIADMGNASHIPIYVQPMDEQDVQKNADNIKLARDLALSQGYRLSLQLHKIVDIP